MDRRWERIKSLFDEAAALDGAAREDFLQDACEGDAELRAEVEELLAFDAVPTGGALDEAALGPQMREGAAAPGERLGRYEIVRVLGSGGMGTVYEAIQDNPRRHVALKTMRRGLESEAARRRFEYEAQVLGGLRHPGVAQVYEAGAVDDPSTGRTVPFFALELVENARPLTRYVTEEQLSGREALSLFVEVCAAVQHGHQRGVLHRDLKPANILVDGNGQPKVIDFGIAKALVDDAELTQMTGAGQILGTLQYLTPEQLDGGADADSRVDVYALGVILYEVLTGDRPFELGETSVTAAIKRLTEADAPAPSKVRPDVSRELDWIVQKAMARTRTERYASVSELAADVERWLAGEPVLAGPPTAGYRLLKFVARHRVAVAVGALVAVGVVAFAVVASVLWLRADSAEKLAQQRLGKLRSEARAHEAVADSMLGLLTDLDPYQSGKPIRPKEVLDGAAARLAALYADKPALAVAVRGALGASYSKIGHPELAKPLFEDALELAKDLPDDDPHRLKAVAGLGNALTDLGDFVAARPLLEDLLRQSEKRFGRLHEQTYEAHFLLGRLHLRDRAHAAAAKHLRAAFDAVLEVHGESHVKAVSFGSALALTLHRDRKEGAEALARSAVERAREHLDPEHPAAQTALNNLASVLVETGRPKEGVPLFEQALALAEKTYGPRSAQTIHITNNLAAACAGIGRLADAERYMRKAIEIGVAPDSVPALIRRHNLARIVELQKRTGEALELYEANLENLRRLVKEKKIPSSHWQVAVAMRGRGACLSIEGEHAEAEKMLLGSLRRLEKQFGDDHRQTQATLRDLAAHYGRSGEKGKAAEIEKRRKRS